MYAPLHRSQTQPLAVGTRRRRGTDPRKPLPKPSGAILRARLLFALHRQPGLGRSIRCLIRNETGFSKNQSHGAEPGHTRAFAGSRHRRLDIAWSGAAVAAVVRTSPLPRRERRRLISDHCLGYVGGVPRCQRRGLRADEPVARRTYGGIEFRCPSSRRPIRGDRGRTWAGDDPPVLMHLEVDRPHLAVQRQPGGRDRRRRHGSMSGQE
jgi:hypothetical protein